MADFANFVSNKRLIIVLKNNQNSVCIKNANTNHNRL